MFTSVPTVNMSYLSTISFSTHQCVHIACAKFVFLHQWPWIRRQSCVVVADARVSDFTDARVSDFTDARVSDFVHCSSSTCLRLFCAFCVGMTSRGHAQRKHCKPRMQPTESNTTRLCQRNNVFPPKFSKLSSLLLPRTVQLPIEP